MPWLSGDVACKGTNRVCAGPAGRSTRLTSVLPSLLWMVTYRVKAQFIALWIRRLMTPDCDQSQAPVCGVRRNVGRATGLNVTRRSTSPSGVCSALDCGRLAS
ncbi:hypothetical protein D3C84_574430 [compost metagenome]